MHRTFEKSKNLPSHSYLSDTAINKLIQINKHNRLNSRLIQDARQTEKIKIRDQPGKTSYLIDSNNLNHNDTDKIDNQTWKHKRLGRHENLKFQEKQTNHQNLTKLPNLSISDMNITKHHLQETLDSLELYKQGLYHEKYGNISSWKGYAGAGSRSEISTVDMELKVPIRQNYLTQAKTNSRWVWDPNLHKLVFQQNLSTRRGMFSSVKYPDYSLEHLRQAEKYSQERRISSSPSDENWESDFNYRLQDLNRLSLPPIYKNQTGQANSHNNNKNFVSGSIETKSTGISFFDKNLTRSISSDFQSKIPRKLGHPNFRTYSSKLDKNLPFKKYPLPETQSDKKNILKTAKNLEKLDDNKEQKVDILHDSEIGFFLGRKSEDCKKYEIFVNVPSFG